MAWHPFRNLKWKALALALGTLLWFTVSGDLSIERSIDDLPVTIKNAPAGMPAAVPVPARVTVTLRGSRESLSDLHQNQIAAWVDVTGLASGQSYKLPVRVDAPVAVDVTKIAPDTVEVRIR